MWDLLIINPMTNALLMFYIWLGQNFILAIAVFTVVIRLLTLPLNMRQQKSSLRMQEMQPQIQAIQKKYKDNPAKMQEEFQKIGYNPADSLMGCLPLLIQFPVLIGLYRGILLLLGATPLSLVLLSQRIYSNIDLASLLPLHSNFLWMDLAQPDPFFILPVVVYLSSFAQQKLLMPRNQNKDAGADENPMASMSRSMQYTMPLMIAFWALTFPSGLSIYWILSNIIGIGQGYFTRRAMPVPQTPAEKKAAQKAQKIIAEGGTLEAPAAEIPANGSKKSVPQPKRKKKKKSRRRR